MSSEYNRLLSSRKKHLLLNVEYVEIDFISTSIKKLPPSNLFILSSHRSRCKNGNFNRHLKICFSVYFHPSRRLLFFTASAFKQHIFRWNWKIGSTAFIQLVLQRSHVIAAKRELYTYCKRKFSVWIKQLNRYGDFTIFSLLSSGRLSRVGNNFLLAFLIAYSGEDETRA